MKKLTVAISAVAASVLMAMSVQAAEIYNKDSNKLDLYGKVNAKHYFSSNDYEDGDKTYARLGFKGETQINDQLTGFGQWEYEFKGNRAESQGSSSDKTRLAFAGLKFGDYGSIDYGRNYGVVYDAIGYTDMLPEFGGDSSYSDNFFSGRNGGLATYRNTNFFGLVDGLNFAVQYLGKNERDDIDISNGDGVGGSISYEYNGFGVVAAYGAANRTFDQRDTLFGQGKKAEQWATGVKYDANNLYLAATYGETHNSTPFDYDLFGNGEITGTAFANKTQDFSVVAQYQFDFGLRPSIAYVQSKGKDLLKGSPIAPFAPALAKKYDTQDLVEYVEIGATYYFNKNMSAFVDYKVNLLDKNYATEALGINTNDIVAVGMVYQF